MLIFIEGIQHKAGKKRRKKYLAFIFKRVYQFFYRAFIQAG